MTLVVYPLLIAWTFFGLLVSPLFFLVWRLVTGLPAGRIARQLIWIYGRSWMAIVAPFVRFRRAGLDQPGIRPPAIFVVNHLSFFDTFCMALLPFSDITFAVRSWPFRMFWYAGFMRLAGYLDVETMNWEECLIAGRRVMERDGFLLFFPEGHRSRSGELQRFYSGAFRLAREFGVPVIPLCLVGTDRLLPPGRRWLRPARVELRALPPVDPAPFADHGELRRHVKALMAGELKAMRQERPA
ncbi:MAG: 1-acyl-sn-glycerol-3-phosphate acyltransferase [Desulfuromonadales bacterium]|nr:1-acyl-sn-glycerol-3-phosphate acyltransferase [Desulfuromonadales bacterium]